MSQEYSVQTWDPPHVTSSPRTPYKVLVADDDSFLVRMLDENLQELGYKVFRAYDGQMAIQMAKQYLPDLIILDVNMPMTSGLKAFEYLRAAADTAKIPVIFVSGETSNTVYPKIANVQRVAHVKKPLDLESFNSLVKLFLRQYPVS